MGFNFLKEDGPYRAEIERLIVSLDSLLTGSRRKDAQEMLRHGSFQSIVKDIYYLSDGGYSRIAFRALEGRDRVFLCLGAQPDVQAMWDTPEAQAVVDLLSAALLAALEHELAKGGAK